MFKGDKGKERNNLFSAYSYEEFEKIHNKEKDIKTKKYNERMIEFGLTPNQIFKNLTYQRYDFKEIENKNCRYHVILIIIVIIKIVK